MTHQQPIYNITQAAKELGLTPTRVRQFCTQGRLGRKIGSFWIIEDEDLKRFSAIKRQWGGSHKKSENTP